MKRAFSMIELVFVFIILSLLSGVAVPKILSIRDDSLIAKAVYNMNNLISDLTLYYSMHSEIADDISKMSNVKLKNGNIFSIANENCFTLNLDKSSTINNGYLYISMLKSKNNDLCDKFFKVGIVKNMINYNNIEQNNIIKNTSMIDYGKSISYFTLEHTAYQTATISLNTNKMEF